jgi:hypothetical protein
MRRRALLGAAAAVVVLVLLAWGAAIDTARPLHQRSLFAALQLASLAGMSLGFATGFERARSSRRRVLFVVAALASWRLSYFPIMVFSGHVASIGEWLLAATGLPIVVYPVFLSAVTLLHALASVAAAELVEPRRVWVAAALAPAFLVATLVSFNKTSDIRLLPDTTTRLERPVPPAREAVENPYLPALLADGYAPNQRVMLLAAGLTYETIPESPWARTVKAVLEGLFEEDPYGSTADRVLEHYLAYHSAHFLIGCRRAADCPLSP